ncbi:MAG: DUF86 domain-containing protein [Spirochaetales bacterium]|nr:DUF86 domain-containing protein [Spirochaetales bacterium]
MYNKELVSNILKQIESSLCTIIKRFSPVTSVDDFYSSEEGFEKLDAICMQLITIGEALKNLDKITNETLLANYPQTDWKGAKGMRDIISHQYFNLDAEIVYDVCKTKVQSMRDTIKQIIEDVSK